MTTLRVGSVPYLVARPLDSKLRQAPGVRLEHDVPARLIARLRAGEIDVALVSSIELFRRPGYRYLDGPVVAGRGFVSSVQVFLRKPTEEVRSIALDPVSRTAATLVQITWRQAFAKALKSGSQDLQFVESPLGQDPAQVESDAWLRIGDKALREYLHTDARPVFNPSQIWTEQTGLPFVFATWIVRPGVELSPEQRLLFLESAQAGEQQMQSWSTQAAAEWNLDSEACHRYLAEECVYDVGRDLQPALETFRDRAAALGLCLPELPAQPMPLLPKEPA